MIRYARHFIFGWTTIALSSVAGAQATSNAIAAAGDAFGYRKGDETIGIYDETSARGFNLESAGNYRVHGAYFVKNSGVSSFFLDSTSVRLGYNTLNLNLPSPSGIVDYVLRDPVKGERSIATIGLDAFGQLYLDVLLKGRSSDDRLSGTVGVGIVPELKDAQGGNDGGSLLVAGTARFKTDRLDLRGFFGEYRYDRPSQFRLTVAPSLLPRELTRGRHINVEHLTDHGQRRIAGLIGDVAIGNQFGVGHTSVATQEDPSRAFLTLLAPSADPTLLSARVIATPAQRTTSLSSELRAYWATGSGERAHRVDALVRLRSSESRFGGTTIFDLGTVAFDRRIEASGEIDATGDAPFRDRIAQTGLGLSYRGRIGSLRLNAGAMRTLFRKRVTGEGLQGSRLDTAHWLYNLSGAFALTPRLEIYAGHSRGLEEAGIAPATALNRYEVLLPAEATQYEVAAIYRLPQLQVVVGAFDLKRGYYATGVGGNFGLIGNVRHRGVELSAAGKIGGSMRIIAGGLILDPLVTSDSGGLQRQFRPIGVARLRAQASIDYDIGRGIHLDATVQFQGRRAATLDATEQQFLPGVTTMGAGLRVPLKLAAIPLTLRAQLFNIFNSYAWDVNSGGTMTYSPQRRFRVALSGEF